MSARALVAAAFALSCGCAGYASFSNHRSARLLAPGHLSVTAAGGYGRYDNAGLVTNGFAAEAMVRRGLSPRWEGGIRLAHLRWHGDPDDFDGENTFIYFDGAYALLPDELAVSAPVGIAYGGGHTRNLQVQPTIVGSTALSPRVALDSSLRLIVATGDDVESFGILSAGFTFGVRLRSDFWRIELHPEAGVMMDDLTDKYGQRGFDSLTYGLSLGVSWLP